MKLACALLCVLGLVASANASILGFNGDSGALWCGVTPGYGSNLPGTPDIAVDCGVFGSVINDFGPDGDVYGDLGPGTIYAWYADGSPATSGPADFKFTFTASNGALAQLVGFDLADYNWLFDIAWDVKDAAGNVLDSGIASDGFPYHTHVDINSAAATSGQLVLTVHSSDLGGNATNVVLDNIEFNQVPEPVTISLLGLGAVALFRKR